MWCPRYWANRFWTPWYWNKGGAGAPAANTSNVTRRKTRWHIH